jgi:hypothetical protein
MGESGGGHARARDESQIGAVALTRSFFAAFDEIPWRSAHPFPAGCGSACG